MKHNMMILISIIAFGAMVFISYSTSQNAVQFSSDGYMMLINGSSGCGDEFKCDCAFGSLEHNCNETTAGCGQDVGAYGHHLTCKIYCDSGSNVSCGFEDDDELVASLLPSCFENSMLYQNYDQAFSLNNE